MDADERVAQNRRRSGRDTPRGALVGVSAVAGQCGSVAAEGEHGQGDQCLGGTEAERDAGQESDLGVGGFDQSLG